MAEPLSDKTWSRYPAGDATGGGMANQAPWTVADAPLDAHRRAYSVQQEQADSTDAWLQDRAAASYPPDSPNPALRRFEQALRSMERAVQSVREQFPPDDDSPAGYAAHDSASEAPLSDPAEESDERTALELDLEGMRSAIHGLSQGLVNVVQRASTGGSETARRITVLAKAVAAIGSKIAAREEDIERLAVRGNERFDIIDHRVRAAEARLDQYSRVEGAVRGLGERLASLDRIDELLAELDRKDSEKTRHLGALEVRLDTIESATKSLEQDAQKSGARLTDAEATLPRMAQALQALDDRTAPLGQWAEELAALSRRVATLDDVDRAIAALTQNGAGIEQKIAAINAALETGAQEMDAAKVAGNRLLERVSSAEERLAALSGIEQKVAALGGRLGALTTAEEAIAVLRAQDAETRATIEGLGGSLASIEQAIAAAAERTEALAGRVQAVEAQATGHPELARKVGDISDHVSALGSEHSALATDSEALRAQMAELAARLEAAEARLSQAFQREEAQAAIANLSDSIVAAKQSEREAFARQMALLEQRLAEIELGLHQGSESTSETGHVFHDNLARLEQKLEAAHQQLEAAQKQILSAADGKAGEFDAKFASLSSQAAESESRNTQIHQEVRQRLADLEDKYSVLAKQADTKPAVAVPDPGPALPPPAEQAFDSDEAKAVGAPAEMPPLVEPDGPIPEAATSLPPKIELPPAALALTEPLPPPEKPVVQDMREYLGKVRNAAREAMERAETQSAGSDPLGRIKTMLNGDRANYVRIGGGVAVVMLLVGLAWTLAFQRPSVPLPSAVVAHTKPVARPAAARTAQAGRTQARAAAFTSPLATTQVRAGKGDSLAMLQLGLMYANGDGVPQDKTKAAEWFGRAANAGQPVAQFMMGLCFEKGIGVAKDAAQALKWYLQAAEHGNRKAMLSLGDAYANGIGTPKNFAEAIRWFQSGAELGLEDAQFNLAVMYERGFGTKASLVDAYKWYSIAAASGDTESKARAEALATQISGEEKAAADEVVGNFKPSPMNPQANAVPPSLPSAIHPGAIADPGH